jgi:hypothetical protein
LLQFLTRSHTQPATAAATAAAAAAASAAEDTAGAAASASTPPSASRVSRTWSTHAAEHAYVALLSRILQSLLVDYCRREDLRVMFSFLSLGAGLAASYCTSRSAGMGLALWRRRRPTARPSAFCCAPRPRRRRQSASLASPSP